LLPPVLSDEAEATLRILPRRGRIAWFLRSRACLAEPPALSPSTRNSSAPSRAAPAGTVGQLAGQAQASRRRGAGDFLVLAALEAFLGPLDDELQEQGRGLRLSGQPVVERVGQGLFHQPVGFGRRELFLGLALEFRARG
jgi:hypothetical protein